MVYFSIRWLNNFPAHGVISDNTSHNSIVTGKNADYPTQCRITFGELAQVDEENLPSNTVDDRNMGEIAMGFTGNPQGGCRFIFLDTRRKITRQKFT